MNRIRQILHARYVAREEAIEICLLGLLSREHVLLLGPPGTAKTSLVETIGKLVGAKFFSRLLTKFSTPEEVFGPLSIPALEQGRYLRLTSGYLPEAEIAFLDEVGKASSAILNALLRIMADREFENDGHVVCCPLEVLFGATNELPEGEAFFDRFPLRAYINDLPDDSSFRLFIQGAVERQKTGQAAITQCMTISELHSFQDAARACIWTSEVTECMVELWKLLQSEGFRVSPRNWEKLVSIAKAKAFLRENCTTTVLPEDLIVLAHMAWREPKDSPKVMALIVKTISPSLAEASRIYDALYEQFRKLMSTNPKQDPAKFLAMLGECNQALKDGEARLATLGSHGKVKEYRDKVSKMRQEVARIGMSALGLGK
ncbi:MAG: AAA family ATPase [Candidatus Methanomethylicaceae archaeon]